MANLFKRGKDDNGNKVYTVNLNKEGFDMDDYRLLQLTAYFHMLKIMFKGDTFNALYTEEEKIYIPYTFTLDETIAIISIHGMKMLYIEFSEDEYIEITFDEIKFVLEKEIYTQCKNILELLKYFDDVPNVYNLKFEDNRKLEWQRLLNNEYEYAMKIGEEFIKNGHILCYPVSGEAFVATNQKQIVEQKGKIEYLAIRSNVFNNRSIMFLHQTKEVIGVGLFPGQEEKLEKIITGRA